MICTFFPFLFSFFPFSSVFIFLLSGVHSANLSTFYLTDFSLFPLCNLSFKFQVSTPFFLFFFLHILGVEVMSGLYTQNFSSARALSPHIRTAPDVERCVLLCWSCFIIIVFSFFCFINFWVLCNFLQSVFDWAVSRVPEASTLHASSSRMQPTFESRFRLHYEFRIWVFCVFIGFIVFARLFSYYSNPVLVLLYISPIFSIYFTVMGMTANWVLTGSSLTFHIEFEDFNFFSICIRVTIVG